MNGDEIWLPVLDFEDIYEVSNFGRVKSLERQARTARGVRTVREKILIHGYHNLGYPRVSLSKNGKRTSMSVHTLVLEAFVGPKPEGMGCRHFPDQNLKNNDRINLSWATHEMAFVSSIRFGENNDNAKLTEEQVRQIVYMEGTQQWIAGCFGISKSQVNNIKLGKSWKHLGLAARESTTTMTRNITA